MQFLNRISLSKKLQIYLSVFLLVSLLFLVVFFVFQYNTLLTDVHSQMTADGNTASTRLVGTMSVMKILQAQAAQDTDMRQFVTTYHYGVSREYTAKISELYMRTLELQENMPGSVLRLAKDCRTMNAYPVFSMTLQEVLEKPWLDPKILKALNVGEVFWARGDLDGSQCLICYSGLYENSKPFELAMVVMYGIPIGQINSLLYKDQDNADVLLVSPDYNTVIGNERLSLPRDAVEELIKLPAGNRFEFNGNRYMVSSMPVSGTDIGLEGWHFVVLRNPQSFQNDSIQVMLLWMGALIVLFVVLTLLNSSVTRHIVSRCRTVMDNIHRITAEKYTENKPLDGQDEFSQINNELIRLSTHLNRLITDEYKRTLLLQQEQIASLQNQINPHYIVNTLEAIRMKLLIQGEKESSQMVQYLAESLRTYAWEPHSQVTIREEITFLERYMALQNYRFINPITYYIEVDDSLLNLSIPHFILQPLIENAIIHGFKNKIEKPHLEISFVLDEGDLYIVISDNGLGMEEEILQKLQERMGREQHQMHSGKGSIGVLNVYWRIKLLYGENCHMQVRSKKGYGTEIEIKLTVGEAL